MNIEDFYIGQKIKLPEAVHKLHFELYGEKLEEFATVTSLESIQTLGIVHYAIRIVSGTCMLGTIHSGELYNLLTKYTEDESI